MLANGFVKLTPENMTGNRRVLQDKDEQLVAQTMFFSSFLCGRRKMRTNTFHDAIENCDLKRFIPYNLRTENLKGHFFST